MDKARKNQLNHFEVDMTKFKDTTKFVVSIIKVGTRGAVYPSIKVPTPPPNLNY